MGAQVEAGQVGTGQVRAGQRPRRNGRRLVALVAVLVLVAAACRGGDNGDGNGGAQAERGAPTAAPGFNPSTKTIRVGAITPQTSLAQLIGIPLTNGNKTYFDALNAQGGIAGKYKVELVVGDSQYNANTAQQVYAGMRDNVVMIGQSLGTDITNALLPQLQADQMLAAPASLDAEWVRDPNLAPIGGPYQIQAINALDYWMRNGGGKDKTVCVMYQDDNYGRAGLEGVEFAQKQMGFDLGVVTSFRATDTNLTAQLQQVKDGSCDAVFLVSLPTTSRVILSQAAADGYTTRWIGQSPTWISLLAEGDLGAYTEANFWLASEGAEWGDTSVPGMNQMLDDIAQFAPEAKPDIYFAFGYSQAWAVAQILERAVARGDLSHAGVLAASEESFTLKFGNLLGDYKYGKASDRVPPDTSTVFAVDPSVPGALKALQQNFSSSAAKKFEIPS